MCDKNTKDIYNLKYIKQNCMFNFIYYEGNIYLYKIILGFH